MTPLPTGRIENTPDGPVLALDRRFVAAPDDVWTSLTHPDWTARWAGRWSGDPASGSIEMSWTAEDGAPTETVRVLECAPPTRLAVITGSEDAGLWRVTVNLTEEAGTTTLTLRHLLRNGVMPSTVGAGWEFYLDRLEAARQQREPAPFSAYDEPMLEYYVALDATLPSD
ncbi:SRPBCC domain-containing protein [Planctomonas psychrotolerans]|uniref:SRPBCC domain-containing protein n=1 Tax=Planctomonas psychrotolerans TaxID=2528712 RepID=UPI001D0CFD9C|nr:SRPBCC domain-containing protein [Planctomonas psychrotolerans]